MAKDYYQILGVNKNASADEIKEAFRRLAHQHHPDKKGGNEAKFKELNEAFQVLSNPEKRGQYDQYGTTFEQAQSQGGGFGGFGGGFGQGQGAQGFDFGDLGEMFSNFGFGDAFSGGGRGGARGGRRARKGQDVQVDVEISLHEAVFGAEKTINLYKTSACDVCSGSGVEPGSKTVTCKECRGSGQVQRAERTFFGTFQTAVQCPTCGGEGQAAEKECKHCRGQGVTKKQQELKVKIPAGIDNGESIRLTGYGEAAKKGGAPGDLFVTIHVKKDQRFTRKGADLYTKQNITFSQAALGSVVGLETIDGHFKLNVPEGIQSGQMIRLKGKGASDLRNTRGDLYVEVLVETPKKLNRKQKELLEELGKNGI